MALILGFSNKSNSFYGEWKVQRPIAYCPIFGMDEETIKNFIGKKAIYKFDMAQFDDEICNNPQYKEEVILDKDFFNGFHVYIKKLGITTDSIKVIEVKDWTNPGSYLIIKDKNSLITVWDGVFFELVRIK